MATIDKDINEALLLDILEVYSGAENKLLNAVAKRVAKGIKEEGWTEKKLESVKQLQEEIEKILDSTSKMSKSKISQGIIDAYKKGYAEVGGPKGVHKTVLDELDIPMNLKMQVLATNNLLDNASFQVLRHANDAYQQVMAQATTGLLAGVDTRIQASQKMLNAFAMKGITSFVDKAGRNWDLSSYAEMCARTVSAHAALQGHIDRQVEVGEDLVKVSTIGTTCPICQRWQNVVLSISGNNPKYHSLEEAKTSGLFHPNCKHTLVMYIPDLDGEGKVEPSEYDTTTGSSKRYDEIQQQRANERKIRYWKKRQAVAITPEEQKKANEKIKYWQHTNLLHCEKHGLRRQYAREGVMQGKIGGPIGPIGYGGSLKEYAELYKDVVGEDPKKVYKKLKMKLDFFGEKEFKKWLRDEIKSLDQLDIDKAMMKDASHKTVTPTSLYKKYIGDNPMKDYAEVSEYEKGTKEYKSGYAKWLKTQIDEIGVSYKIKPEYVEIHEDIPIEDTKLSATEIYKKYHDGASPTEAFKKLGGEEGTGMKYGKWVETKKKELIRDGITKTVPFSSVTTEKTIKLIKEVSEGIEKAKSFVDEPAIKKYKEDISKIKDAKTLSLKMRDISSEIKVSKGHDKEMLERKYEVLKERDLEILREKVKTAKLGSSSGDVDFEMKWLKEHVLDKKGIDEEVKEHVKKKYDILAKRKDELEIERKEKEEKLKEEIRRKAVADGFKSRLRDFTEKEIEELKKSTFFKKDPDYDIKLKAIEEFKVEQKKAKAKKEADEKRMKELERRRQELEILRSSGNHIPRDIGAKILDDLDEFYNGSTVKNKADKIVNDIAVSLNISKQEAKMQIDNDLKEIFQECEFGARIKGSVLEKVLSDDPNESGFKNLFEVGTGGGCTNKTSRSNGENRVFGYKGAESDWNKNKADRPFYGMMMPKFEKGNFSEHYYKSGPGRWYGDGITLTFDKSIASNVSFTLGDSLDYSGSVIGCDALNPEFRGAYSSFKDRYVEAKKSVNNSSPSLMLTKIAKDGDKYLELQYHGNQTKKDMTNFISHVYIESGYRDKKGIIKLFEKKNIPYTVI